MMDNMKIAVICNSYPTRINKNNQIFIKNINDELSKLAVDCNVYYNPIFNYWSDPSSHKNIFANLIKYTFFFMGLVKIIFNIKSYQILNPHGVIFSGFSAIILKSIFKIPVILYIHGGDLNLYPSASPYYQKIYNYTINRSDIIIVNSNDIKNKLLSYTNVNSKIVRVISPGINLDHFFPLPKNKVKKFKKRYHISQDKIILLFVGNAIKRKGLDIFVDALSLLDPNQLNKIEVMFCTNGPELSKIKSKVFKLHLLHSITKYFDKVDQTTLNIFYNMATVFVFPSRDEPLGLVGLEAIASGTPVIGANIGGIPEYINDDNGILFESGNPHDLANVIKKLIDDKSQLIKFTSNLGSQHTKHSIHRSALSLKSLYEIFLK